MRPVTLEAFRLLHEGSRTLAKIEHNGIRIDRKYLRQQQVEVSEKIEAAEADLKRDRNWKLWRREFKDKANLQSGKQLEFVAYDLLGYKAKKTTMKGRRSTDQSAFEDIDDPFFKKYIEWKQLLKLRDTYITNILSETDDKGYLHAVYNLHIAKTFRSSSSDPNFQNIPVRNDFIAKIIRSAFVPRKGRVLIEADYSGIEVCIAGCYTLDPRLINYIEDKSTDMHRDMASECYACSTEQVSKKMRYGGKNMFVFPQFYGSWYAECAKNLWEYVGRSKLTMEDGTLVSKHLRRQGLRDIESYVEYIKGVEDRFWNERFQVYSEWKREWWSDYLRTGGWLTKTGFRVSGIYSRNEVINAPIQGSAFHCLLWSLPRIEREIRRRRMDTLLVGQIHDSILADVPRQEVDEYIEIIRKVMTRDIKRTWDWIVVPLEIEVEGSEVNWFSKKVIGV